MKTIEVSSQVQIKNILFTTDFSPAANAAIPHAIELSKRYGAKIYALHVRPPVINPMTQPATWKELERAAEIEEQRERHELLESFQGIRPEILIKEGDLWSNLAEIIEQSQIDLIVVGTRGRSGIHKLALGSVAEEIFRQAQCPVLTVGPHSLGPKQRSYGFTSILLATDFGDESAAATKYAVSLAQEYQTQLTLLHVIEEPKTGELVRPFELVTSSMHLLRKLVTPETERLCLPECVVELGEVAKRILEVAKKQKADLIVLGIRRPSGVPGAATHLPKAIAHKIVSSADCPVLTVRS
jgi:nucleotide-binding universal stress UspA family protein